MPSRADKRLEGIPNFLEIKSLKYLKESDLYCR